MYTATMEYYFKPENLEKISQLWKDKVMVLAEKQPGFVRMQFLTSGEGAMAIGTWKNKSDAEEFMKTGVFKDLMQVLSELLTNPPVPKIWDLRYFSEG